MLEKFLCCFDLETGGLLIGYAGALFYLFIAIVLPFVVDYGNVECRLEEQNGGPGQGLVLLYAIILSMLIFVGYAYACFLLVEATIKVIY